jgi:hypothetical protein
MISNIFSAFFVKTKCAYRVGLAGWLETLRSQNWKEIETSGFLQSIL